MIIRMILYNNDAITRVSKKTFKFFEKNKGKRFYEDTIWLDNMYIELYKRVITINVFKGDSDWEIVVNDYMQKVLFNEEVSINYKEESQYFKSYTNFCLMS